MSSHHYLNKSVYLRLFTMLSSLIFSKWGKRKVARDCVILCTNIILSSEEPQENGINHHAYFIVKVAAAWRVEGKVLVTAALDGFAATALWKASLLFPAASSVTHAASQFLLCFANSNLMSFLTCFTEVRKIPLNVDSWYSFLLPLTQHKAFRAWQTS